MSVKEDHATFVIQLPHSLLVERVTYDERSNQVTIIPRLSRPSKKGSYKTHQVFYLIVTRPGRKQMIREINYSPSAHRLFFRNPYEDDNEVVPEGGDA